MIYLINPALVSQKGDSHSSGIPYLPHGLAYLSSAFDKKGIAHQVIDCFGLEPKENHSIGAYRFSGLSPQKLIGLIQEPSAFVLYASSVFNSRSVFQIADELAKHYSVPFILIENTQAVTGFSILKAADQLTKTPFTHVVLGESEAVLPDAISSLLRGSIAPEHEAHVWRVGTPTNGKTNAIVHDLDSLPFPSWERFPLTNYWKLGFAHGPKSGRYLALLTSRGCPYPCTFCSVPVMNEGKWRMMSAERVVDEMEHFYRKLRVVEFHWEDLNPTIKEERMLKISSEILRRKLPLRWRLVSGTKMDNLKVSTLELMAKSGLDYLSFSPESGSKEVMARVKKPFRHEHALTQVKRLRELGVETQACFILGFPGETDSDRALTKSYSKSLLQAGLGELAYFIVAPMPGTPIEGLIGEKRELSELTFSPTWRADYRELIRWRDRLYLQFFLYRIFRTPVRFFQNCIRALQGRSRLKMEMFLRRRLSLRGL